MKKGSRKTEQDEFLPNFFLAELHAGFRVKRNMQRGGCGNCTGVAGPVRERRGYGADPGTPPPATKRRSEEVILRVTPGSPKGATRGYKLKHRWCCCPGIHTSGAAQPLLAGMRGAECGMENGKWKMENAKWF